MLIKNFKTYADLEAFVNSNPIEGRYLVEKNELFSNEPTEYLYINSLILIGTNTSQGVSVRQEVKMQRTAGQQDSILIEGTKVLVDAYRIDNSLSQTQLLKDFNAEDESGFIYDPLNVVFDGVVKLKETITNQAMIYERDEGVGKVFSAQIDLTNVNFFKSLRIQEV